MSLLEWKTEVEQLRLLVQTPESKRAPGARTPVFDRERSGRWVYIAQGLVRSSNTVGSSIPRANSLINWQCTLGKRKIKLSKRLAADGKYEKAPPTRWLPVPDVDGRVGQDFAVAVPAAVGGGAAAGRVVSADLAEDLAFAVLP